MLAADQFTITTAGRPTAVAGYPWFGEWSRDLMTSYEGLYLATNRHDEGREVLLASAATLSEGMLANTADTGSLEYNTVDGTLWFVHAVGRHVAVTGDEDLGNELAPVLEQIVDHHLEGTRFGISVDPADGLLRQGAEGWALTWMDARIDGVPVTPRAGKPVEVNALWLRALDVAAELAGDDDRFASLRERAASSFVARFVRPDGGRPPRRGRRPGRGRRVRAAEPAPRGVAAERAAGRRDRRPRRRGVQPEPPHPARAALARPRRPRATAPTIAAARPTATPPTTRAPCGRGFSGRTWTPPGACRPPLDGVLDGIEAHLGEWGLGSISETADGAAPHLATGCPFQAWSVAELLRIRRDAQATLTRGRVTKPLPRSADSRV